MTERERTIKLLSQLYGPLKKGERIELKNYSLKEVAADLGYDEGQLSRNLNPGHGKKKSDETYRRINHRLKMNQAAKKAKLWKVLTTVFAFGCVVLGLLLITTNSSEPNPKIEIKERRLTKEEVAEITDLFNGYIRSQLVVRGLVFNSNFKEGIYKLDDIEEHAGLLESQVKDLLSGSRKQLGKAHLIAENGVELSSMYERFNRNNIDSNLSAILKVLIEPNISAAQIEEAIENRVKGIQRENVAVFDSIISLPQAEAVKLFQD